MDYFAACVMVPLSLHRPPHRGLCA